MAPFDLSTANTSDIKTIRGNPLKWAKRFYFLRKLIVSHYLPDFYIKLDHYQWIQQKMHGIGTEHADK